MFVRRYIQGKAKFYGAELELTYRPTPDYEIKLFGDYVKGRLFDLPSQIGQVHRKGFVYIDDEGLLQEGWDKPYRIEMLARNDRHAPRVPPIRVGLKFSGKLTENLSFLADYTYVFGQTKTAESLSIKEQNGKEESDYVEIDDDNEKKIYTLLEGVNYTEYNKTGKTITELDNLYPAETDDTLDYDDPSYDTRTEFEKVLSAIRLKEKNLEDFPFIKEKIFEDSTKGYHLLNLGLRYERTFKKVDYAVEFNVNNVLNQKIYIHTSHQPYVPQMGRNYSLNLSVKF